MTRFNLNNKRELVYDARVGDLAETLGKFKDKYAANPELFEIFLRLERASTKTKGAVVLKG